MFPNFLSLSLPNTGVGVYYLIQYTILLFNRRLYILNHYGLTMTGDMDTRFMQYLRINRELRGVYNQAFNDGSLLEYDLVDEDPTPDGIIQDYQEGRPIRIYTGFSAGSIWGTESNNYMFRALHDSFHLKNGYPFTLEGEIRVANSLRAYADLHGFKLFGWLQYLDTVLPAIYYEINNEFPSQEYIKNQIKEYMKKE